MLPWWPPFGMIIVVTASMYNAICGCNELKRFVSVVFILIGTLIMSIPGGK